MHSCLNTKCVAHLNFFAAHFHGRIILSPASVSVKPHAAAGIFRLRAALKAVHRGYSQQEFFN